MTPHHPPRLTRRWAVRRIEMTRKQREQVVELLRCAADDQNSMTIWGIFGAGEEIYGTWLHPVVTTAFKAARTYDTGAYDNESYRGELLEAALRIEQGEWP